MADHSSFFNIRRSLELGPHSTPSKSDPITRALNRLQAPLRRLTSRAWGKKGRVELNGSGSTKARPNTYAGSTGIRKASISGPTPARPSSMYLPYHFDRHFSIPNEAWSPSLPTWTTYTPNYISTDSQSRVVVVDLDRRASYLVELDHTFPAGAADALDVAMQTFFGRSTPEVHSGSAWSNDSEDDDEPGSYPESLAASDDTDSLMDPDDLFLSQFPRLSIESFPHFDDFFIPSSFFLSQSNDSDVFHECYETEEEMEKARSDCSDAYSASSMSSPSSFGDQSFNTYLSEEESSGSESSSIRGVESKSGGLDLRDIDGLLEGTHEKRGERRWRRSL